MSSTRLTLEDLSRLLKVVSLLEEWVSAIQSYTLCLVKKKVEGLVHNLVDREIQQKLEKAEQAAENLKPLLGDEAFNQKLRDVIQLFAPTAPSPD